MAWMFFFFAALLIIYCLKIVSLCGNNPERAHKLTLWSIPVALLFYLTNGYIFGMISSQPLWGGAFTTVWFLLAALLSGGALLGVLGWAQGFDDNIMLGYGRMLCVLLAAFAVFEALWLLTGVQGGDAETARALKTLCPAPALSHSGGCMWLWALLCRFSCCSPPKTPRAWALVRLSPRWPLFRPVGVLWCRRKAPNRLKVWPMPSNMRAWPMFTRRHPANGLPRFSCFRCAWWPCSSGRA